MARRISAEKALVRAEGITQVIRLFPGKRACTFAFTKEAKIQRTANGGATYVSWLDQAVNLYEFWKNITKRKPRKMWFGKRLVSDNLAAEYLAKCHDEKNKVQRLKRVSGEWCYTRLFMRLHQRKHRKYVP